MKARILLAVASVVALLALVGAYTPLPTHLGGPVMRADIDARFNGANEIDPLLGTGTVVVGGALLTGLYNGVINVQDPAYGAKGDGVTDDTAAIQAALNAACANVNHTLDVYLPATASCYKITTPIHISCSGIGVYGQQGPFATKICSNYWGPVVLHESATLNQIKYGAALVGSGKSLDTTSYVIDSSGPYGFLTLGEVLNNASQSFNGLSSFDIEFWWEDTNLVGAGGTTQGILASYTSTPGTGVNLYAFDFELNSATTAITSANFSTSGKVSMPTWTPVVNTVYDIALDDNAGTCRLFVNGVQQGSNTTCTGTTVQGPYETLTLPSFNAGYFPGAHSTINPATGFIDAIHIQNTSVHTGNYTPASSKPVANAHTLVLINFDQPTGTQAGTQPAYVGNSSVFNAFIPVRGAGFGISNDHISRLELCPGTLSAHPSGIFINQLSNSEWDHINCSFDTYIGMDFDNVQFQSSVHDNKVGGGDLCYYLHDFTEGTLAYNLCSQNGIAHTCYFSDSSSYIDEYAQCQNANSPGDIIYGWVDNMSHNKHVFPFLDNEGTGAGLLGMFYITNSYAPESIENAEFGSTNSAPLLEQHQGGAPTRITEAYLFDGGTAPAEVVNFTGTATNGPVVLENNTIPASVPLSNNLALISTPGCVGTATLSSGAGTVTQTCISTASICNGVDITTPANAVTIGTLATGSVTVTGTGSDVVKVVCQ